MIAKQKTFNAKIKATIIETLQFFDRSIVFQIDEPAQNVVHSTQVVQFRSD